MGEEYYARLAVVLILGALLWGHGYFTGKSAGIREVARYLDEQWRCFERFRDVVYKELGIEIRR